MTTIKTAFVVLAEFEFPLAHRDEFLELCRFDGTRSVADEPGCRQFDVNTTGESPDQIVLYEVYDDAAAFEAHKSMPHYAVFAAGVERLGVQLRSLRFFDRQHP